MTIYTGTVRKVGDGAKCIFTPSTVISVVEVGDDTIRNLRVSPFMSTYLKESIGHNTDIAVYHNWMCAIKLADGRIIVDDTVNKHLLMVVFAWGVLTIPLFGIGLIFVGLTIYKYVRIKKQAALVAELSRTV
jgi:hypothetical protein